MEKQGRKENITLIGMPGSGKSTVGVLLAKALGYEFLDTDLLIQKQEGKLLWQIIEAKGLAAFKEIENQVNAGVTCTRTVIAPGGSVVYGREAMEHLKNISTVIYLKLSCETATKRVQNAAKRGVAMGEGQSLQDLYYERCPLYEKYADLTIDAEQALPEEVMSLILNCFA